jgi:hypothetical protein
MFTCDRAAGTVPEETTAVITRLRAAVRGRSSPGLLAHVAVYALGRDAEQLADLLDRVLPRAASRSLS